jgi:hypothetical protein
MESIGALGRLLIVIGIGVLIAGLVLLLIGNVSSIGRLPGDIVVRRGPITIFFPIVTMLIVSVVMTVVLNVLFRLFR